MNAVPHLITALSGPLLELETHLLKHQTIIEGWLRHQWLDTPAPFYASVDLRNASFKLAPVDTNLFPAGFNNLNPGFMALCIHAVQSAIERICPTAYKIIIIPENHTRNLYYLESLATLSNIIDLAGFEVKIGSLQHSEPLSIALPSKQNLTLYPMTRKKQRLVIKDQDFDPCLVLLNNDLSGGRPEILENLEQDIAPPLHFGWINRLKSNHFFEYKQVCQEFSQLLEIDPWLIDPLYRNCGEINFMKREGEDCLVRNVETLLDAIQLKYQQYQIKRPPFVIVKADAGTYGMGIMTAHSTDDVRQLNRRQRTKMATNKEGNNVTQVIIQEGIYTDETWGEQQAVAEPVVYMIDHFVVGGFYRIHSQRKSNENLNAPGMSFQPLAFAKSCTIPDRKQQANAQPNRFYAYGVIARLALLAAAREIAYH